MTQLTEEQSKGVKEIERWLTLRTSAHSDPYADLSRALGYIRFLTPLLDSDSQAAGDKSASELDTTSEKREERMLQTLIETPAGERIRMKCGTADLRSVMTDLLSLLPYVVNEVDAERLADYHKIGSIPAIVKSVDYGATSLAQCVEMAVDRWYYRGRKDAATSMRDKCVVHLQTTADALDVRQETECPSGSAFNSEAVLRRRIATELSSLTLDPLEPEKQKWTRKIS